MTRAAQNHTRKTDRAACSTTAVLQLGETDQNPSVSNEQEAAGGPMLGLGALLIQQVMTLTHVHSLSSSTEVLLNRGSRLGC